jgi:chemotaxis methyl-accepting protein methylase
MTKDMTTGSPMKNILRFCLPLMVGNLFQQFYNMADIIIVGRFVGKTALSAVGSVGSLNFLVIGSVIGLCTGFSVPVAQRFGAQDEKGLKKCVANITYVSVVLGVVLTLGAVLLTNPLLKLLNTPEDIYTDAYNYIIIIFAGIGATMFYNLLAALVRSLGDSRTPLYFLLFSSALNIGLDILLITVFHMGVRGAAVATVVSQFISGVLCFIYVKRSFPVLHVTKETRAIDFSFIKDGLQNYKRFTVSPVNMEWIRNRYDSWEKERGKNLQLTNDSDAEEFLKSFYSMHTGSFWSESYANQVFDSLPNNDARQIVVWNPGCGKGYETYSLACILKKRYPEARIKIYAHEVDLLSISNAPLLALPSDAAESWYKPFTSKTVSGEYTFIQNIKDMILFEYHDCMHTNAMPAVDIIFARDILSFMNEQGQTDLLNEFGEKVKGNGCLILGDNEQVPAGNTSWSASSANQISMYLKH